MCFGIIKRGQKKPGESVSWASCWGPGLGWEHTDDSFTEHLLYANKYDNHFFQGLTYLILTMLPEVVIHIIAIVDRETETPNTVPALGRGS